MRRLLIAAALILAAIPAAAFDPRPAGPLRIGILRAASENEEQVQYAAALVRTYLRRELETRKFEVIEFDGTYKDLVNAEQPPAADFFIEVEGWGEAIPYGGVGLNGRYAGTNVTLSSVRIGTTLNVYAGDTLRSIETFDLQEKSTSLTPTAIGVGSYAVNVWGGFPVVPWAMRSTAKKVARRAADSVAQITQR